MAGVVESTMVAPPRVPTTTLVLQRTMTMVQVPNSIAASARTPVRANSGVNVAVIRRTKVAPNVLQA